MAIVYAQHDLGTMLVIMVCAAAVLVIAGLKPVHIVVLLLLGVTLVGAAVVTGKVRRISSTGSRASPTSRPATSPRRQQTQTEYNLSASKAAIVGRVRRARAWARACRPRTASCPSSTPTSSSRRSVRTSASSAARRCSALYALLAWRLWRIALLSSDFFGTLVAIGVLAMFAIQIFENVGMTMGIMPITGIPLPFMSYGGSAVIASFIAIGLVANVHMRRFS